MNPGAVVFALANPDPEIDPLEAQQHAAVVATGRSDFPNQINNVLAFPGVFRGLLDAQATEITDDMLVAAAEAIANVVSPDQLNASYIVPSVFDENVSKAVARAVVGGVADVARPGSAAAPRNRRCRDRCRVPRPARRPATGADPCRCQRRGPDGRRLGEAADPPGRRWPPACCAPPPRWSRLLQQGGLPKGDALATARIAGIMAAKRTPDLVPLCHPISISGVTVDLEVGDAEVRITATVRTTDRTGVEMEALTAVAVAGLTLHDMIKAVDPAAVLDAVRVERKDGGKTGTWTRPEDRCEPGRPTRTAVVIIASTRAATGVYPDRTGPVIAEWLTARGFDVARTAGLRRRPDVSAARVAGRPVGARPGDHLRRHRHLADRPDPAGHRRCPGLRDPRAGRGDPGRGQRQGADRGAVPWAGRRGRPDAGGQPARVRPAGCGTAWPCWTGCSTTRSISCAAATTVAGGGT